MKLFQIEYRAFYEGFTFESKTVVPIVDDNKVSEEANNIIKAIVEANPNPKYKGFEVVSISEQK